MTIDCKIGGYNSHKFSQKVFVALEASMVDEYPYADNHYDGVYVVQVSVEFFMMGY